MALLGNLNVKQLNLSRAGPSSKAAPALPARVSRRSAVRCNAAASTSTDELGFKKMREGIKEASAETILTPRL